MAVHVIAILHIRSTWEVSLEFLPSHSGQLLGFLPRYVCSHPGLTHSEGLPEPSRAFVGIQDAVLQEEFGLLWECVSAVGGFAWLHIFIMMGKGSRQFSARYKGQTEPFLVGLLRM